MWKLSEQNARDDTIFAPSFMFAKRVFNCTQDAYIAASYNSNNNPHDTYIQNSWLVET